MWSEANARWDLNEVHRAEHEYDCGFDRQATTMSKYPELLDEAVQISMNIQDFTKRADSLIEIGKQYLAHAQAEKGLAVLRRAEQYLNDSSRKANIRLLVEQELVKLRRCYFGDQDEK